MIILIYLLVSLLLCFCGYEMFRTLVSVAVGLLAWTLVANYVSQQTHSDTFAIISGLISFVIGYSAAKDLYQFAVFVSGAYGGYCLAYLQASGHPSTGGWLITAVIVGLASVALEKFVIVVTTAFTGALGITVSVAAIFGLLTLPNAMSLAIIQQEASSISRQAAWFFFWVMLGICGSISQYTKKEKEDESTATLRKSENAASAEEI